MSVAFRCLETELSPARNADKKYQTLNEYLSLALIALVPGAKPRGPMDLHRKGPSVSYVLVPLSEVSLDHSRIHRTGRARIAGRVSEDVDAETDEGYESLFCTLRPEVVTTVLPLFLDPLVGRA